MRHRLGHQSGRIEPVPHRTKTPGGEIVVLDVHFGGSAKDSCSSTGGCLLAEGIHAEGHLTHRVASLVIADLELKERKARQEAGTIGSHRDDLAEVLLLSHSKGRVILPNEDRHALEVPLIRIEEEVAELHGGIRRVDATHEACLVGQPNVVARPVAIGLRVPHRMQKLRHLPQARTIVEALAELAYPEREGASDVRQWPHNTRLFLCLEQPIEGADQCLAEDLWEGSGRQL
mmetsp:Transcript_64915/g.143357  ORF Transcript_64915/g.143357 Transcript_64915/m.143357 type:complete len:232 (+) Transcript_64915:184-879(+)